MKVIAIVACLLFVSCAPSTSTSRGSGTFARSNLIGVGIITGDMGQRASETLIDALSGVGFKVIDIRALTNNQADLQITGSIEEFYNSYGATGRVAVSTIRVVSGKEGQVITSYKLSANNLLGAPRLNDHVNNVVNQIARDFLP
jgi:hypothetical protein